MLFGVLGSTLTFASACDHPSPGRCNNSNDCPTGQMCDLSPQANGTCVCASPGCMDGGAGASGSSGASGGTGGSGGMAGAGGMPDGSAGAGACQPACTAPKVCAATACVECITSADCLTTTKPICDATTNTCVPCTSDDQCVGKLGSDPGVCMAHEDGRCATPAETIFVQNAAGCDDPPSYDPTAGSAERPLCSMQPVPSLLEDARKLIVVTGLVTGGTWNYSGAFSFSIVGRQKAEIVATVTPALNISTGNIYIRDVNFGSPGSTCIAFAGLSLTLDGVVLDPCGLNGLQATGGTVVMRSVTVNRSSGGVLLRNSPFDIENCTISNNEASSDGSWAGIDVENPPAGGPPARLSMVTVQSNAGPGIVCSGAVQGDGVYASGNSAPDIAPACGFTSCGTSSATCGASL
jgi:hypothetical protein